MSNLLKKEKGFTLIEVVIVLAIGALIILVVLQAVAAAQRSQRDSARKSEGARVVSLMEQFASNNNGLYPASAAAADTALATYDNTLALKYDFQATVCTDANSDSSTYVMQYVPASAANRDYTLNVCIESGMTTNVHQP